ncbi:MAG TPA: pitrilysin family protein [Abditibacteriaceae bacterium]|jgi:predicted Zn-dependent peptidase
MQHKFEKTVLPNGLRVLTERHEHVHSATLGVWIEGGSVYERDNERGLAHLLEHLVFKGTQRRSMNQIAVAMDQIGGQMNAFTEREFVCYHVKVLAEHAPVAMELLCDFVARPVLNADDLDMEKGVVIEEIKSVEDAPEELVEDLFMETIWSRSRWGRSILGTPESVSKMQVEDLRRFLATHYTPQNIVVVAVGDVQHDAIVKLAEELLNDLPTTKSAAHRIPVGPKVRAQNVQMSRETEQVHLCCGTRAFSYNDPKRYPGWLLDTVMTGGYSSRLFQEIREKRGLCYNIGPMSASYRSAGFWALETSVAPDKAHKVAALISKELKKVRDKGVTRAELKRAQQMSRVNVLLAEESSSAQMTRIARNELYFGRQKSSKEILDTVMAVTLDDVQGVAREMFDPTLMNIAAVGPFEGKPPLTIDLS